MTDSEKIASLEARLLDVTARLDQIDNKKQVGFYEIPENDFDPRIPLAQEVSSSFTQSAKRTDVQVSWSNPDPGRIERFELWAENVTGQSKEPYLVASVDNSPASFSLEADQDTAVSVFIRTITRDGLSSTLRGSPAIGVSIVQQPLGASDIADGSIGDSKLDRVTDPIVIDTADIANLAVGNAQINDLAATKITAGTLDVGVLLASNIAATQISAGTLGAGVILASNIAATQISAGTLAAGVILASNIAASQISAGTLSAVNLSAGTFTLTSGSNTFDINGTDGFAQRNTSTNDEVYIDDGIVSCQSSSSSHTGELQAGIFQLRNNTSQLVVRALSGGTDLGQTNSGYLSVETSSSGVAVELGVDSGGSGVIHIDGTQVLTSQQTTVTKPTGGSTIDTEGRTAIDGIIDVLEAHGIMA